MSSERRVKLVPVMEQDLRRLMEAAATLGIPLRLLLASLMRVAPELALLSGGRLEGLEAEYRAWKELVRLGFVPMPLSILNRVVLRGDVEELAQEARETGKAIGSVYRLSGLNDEARLEGFLRSLFPDSAQATLRQESGSRVRVTLVAMGRGRELMKLSAALIEGFMDGLGYKLSAADITTGIAVLTFERVER